MQDRVEDEIGLLPHVFGKKPQHEIAVFLQEEVFAAVAAVPSPN
jgi:hypothetical protein